MDTGPTHVGRPVQPFFCWFPEFLT
jgi:hypothetical protein